MSTETITIIVSALALAVTIIGSLCGLGAWALARIDRRFTSVETGLRTEIAGLETNLRTEIARVDTRIDDFAASVDERFEAVDRRFDAVDKRFDAVDRRFEAVDQRLSALRDDVREVAIAVARWEGPQPRLYIGHT